MFDRVLNTLWYPRLICPRDVCISKSQTEDRNLIWRPRKRQKNILRLYINKVNGFLGIPMHSRLGSFFYDRRTLRRQKRWTEIEAYYKVMKHFCRYFVYLLINNVLNSRVLRKVALFYRIRVDQRDAAFNKCLFPGALPVLHLTAFSFSQSLGSFGFLFYRT